MNKYRQYINNPDYEFIKYEQGGELGQDNNLTQINTEGSGRAQGTKQQMSSGELLVKSGRIIKSYVNFPPHPDEGTNPEGNTLEEPNSIVIPKKRTQEYLNSDMRNRKMIERSLVSQQQDRMKKAQKVMEDGGAVYKQGGMLDYRNNSITPKEAYTFGTPNIPGMDNSHTYTFSPDQIRGKYPQRTLRFNPSTIGQNAIYKQGGFIPRMDGTDGYVVPQEINNNGFDPNNSYYNSVGRFNPNYSSNRGYGSTSDNSNYSNYGTNDITPMRGLQTNSVQGSNSDSYSNPQYRTSNNSPYNYSPSPKDDKSDPSQYLYPSYQLAKGLFDTPETYKPERVNPLQPKYINQNTGKQEIQDAYNTSYYNLKNSGQYSRGTQTAMMVQRGKLDSNRRLNIENQNSNIYNQYVGQKLGADQYNSQNQARADEMLLGAKSRQNQYIEEGLNNFGKIAQNRRNNSKYEEWIKKYIG